MDWYSALLTFEAKLLPSNPECKRRIDSLMVFRALDWENAEAKAREFGRVRAEKESVRHSTGEWMVRLGDSLNFNRRLRWHNAKQDAGADHNSCNMAGCNERGAILCRHTAARADAPAKPKLDSKRLIR